MLINILIKSIHIYILSNSKTCGLTSSKSPLSFPSSLLSSSSVSSSYPSWSSSITSSLISSPLDASAVASLSYSSSSCSVLLLRPMSWTIGNYYELCLWCLVTTVYNVSSSASSISSNVISYISCQYFI